MTPTAIAPKPSVSPQPPATFPGSPTFLSFPQFVAVDDFKRLVVGLIKEAQKAEYTNKVQIITPEAEKNVSPVESKARASRLKYKTVNERYFPLQAYIIKLNTVQLE